MNVNLRLLRAFVTVSQEGGVGRAAARLFVSQPALSQDIRRLERELGVVLFDRGPKGMTLTAVGTQLLQSVEAGLSHIDRGIADAQAHAASDRVTVRVAYSPSIGNQFMPALLPIIESRLPGLSIDEREVDTGEVGPGVASGRFDAGLAHCPAPDPALTLSHLADEPLCVALADTHRLAQRDQVRLAELDGSTLLIWPRETAPEYFDEILGICERAGVNLKSVTEVPHLTPRSYLLDDQTFSLVPRSAATIQRPEVSFVALEDRGCTVPLMFVRRADDEREAITRIEELSRRTSELLINSIGA